MLRKFPGSATNVGLSDYSTTYFSVTTTFNSFVNVLFESFVSVVDNKWQKVRLVLTYFRFQTQLSSAIFASFVPQGVSRRLFGLSKHFFLRRTIRF